MEKFLKVKFHDSGRGFEYLVPTAVKGNMNSDSRAWIYFIYFYISFCF